jgi:hypothetical protein
MLSRLPRFSTHNVSAYRRHIVAYNWTIVVASTIASFIPLFMYGQQWAGGFPAGKFGYLNKFTKPPLTNAQLYAYTGNNYQIDTTTRNTVDSVYMGMAIPTALDLLLELYAEWTAEKGQESMHVVRLSWVERAVFVLGVFFYGSVYLFPQGWNIMARDNMNYAFESASTILTTGPILIFLERTTAAFPPIFTAVVLTVLCAGCVVESSLVLTLTKADFLYMNSIAQPLVYVPCALIVMACVWCFINYVRGSGYMRVDGDAAKHQLNAQSDTYRDFCTNKVRVLNVCTCPPHSLSPTLSPPPLGTGAGLPHGLARSRVVGHDCVVHHDGPKQQRDADLPDFVHGVGVRYRNAHPSK